MTNQTVLVESGNFQLLEMDGEYSIYRTGDNRTRERSSDYSAIAHLWNTCYNPEGDRAAPIRLPHGELVRIDLDPIDLDPIDNNGDPINRKPRDFTSIERSNYRYSATKLNIWARSTACYVADATGRERAIAFRTYKGCLQYQVLGRGGWLHVLGQESRIVVSRTDYGLSKLGKP
jgi:hypothetical protein